MKPIILAIVFLAVFSLAKAQESAPSRHDQIFTAVEKDPAFKGGLENFYKYLAYNIHYPSDAVKNHNQGKVFVTFVVEKDGSLTDVKILRGVSDDIDTEAVRVVRASPKWTPGVQNGRLVRVQYSLVINFKLPPPELHSHLTDSLMNVPFEKKIFSVVEQDPTFPGGVGKLYQYVQRNLKYPEIALRNKVHGKVIVNFVVENDGSLTNIEVRKHDGLTSETDAEAIRLIKESPIWNPGILNGRPVRVQYSLPINFTLAN